MGKVTVVWLLASVEALVQGEEPKKFIKSFRVGRRAFLAQRLLLMVMDGSYTGTMVREALLPSQKS
jgi:hypothetical protein